MLQQQHRTDIDSDSAHRARNGPILISNSPRGPNSGGHQDYCLRAGPGCPYDFCNYSIHLNAQPFCMTVIDVHTHILTHDYLELLTKRSGGQYEIKLTSGGQRSVHKGALECLDLTDEMLDCELRIRDMDEGRVDLAIVSLTYPSVYFGDEVVSKTTARIVNTAMAEQQGLWPSRIRWFASLPWQYEEASILELKYAVANGAIGVFVTANIEGMPLTDPALASVWAEINRLKLPVLVHPAPPVYLQSTMLDAYGLIAPVGFLIDMTLAISHMIMDGFIDRYPDIKLIAANGGGALPYIAGQLDRAHKVMPACSAVIKDKPSSYLQRIYYDAAVVDQSALELCARVGTENNLMFGSDYPNYLGDIKGCLSRVEALPRSMVSKVQGENARRVFNL
jgi:aminocarboxymuconate-semialdehyde decarboxylase